LTVKASRQRDMGEEKNGLEHRETSHGSFERSMTLPE
jgi:HSP20 family molecular chaperone IbpA